MAVELDARNDCLCFWMVLCRCLGGNFLSKLTLVGFISGTYYYNQTRNPKPKILPI